jgi:hypothetical protein
MADDAAVGVEQIDLERRVQAHRVHRQFGQQALVGAAVGADQRPRLLGGDGGGQAELQALRGLQRLERGLAACRGEQRRGQQRQHQQGRSGQPHVQPAERGDARGQAAPQASKR